MDERFQIVMHEDNQQSQLLGQFAKFAADVARGGEQVFPNTDLELNILHSKRGS